MEQINSDFIFWAGKPRELKHWSHFILRDLNCYMLILNIYKTMDLNVLEKFRVCGMFRVRIRV